MSDKALPDALGDLRHAIAVAAQSQPDWKPVWDDAFQVIQSRLSQAEADLAGARGWRPIESAPNLTSVADEKEGWVLGLYLTDPVAPVWTVRQVNGGWYGDHHSTVWATDKPVPDYWMPLPPPPSNLDRKGT